MKEGEQDTVIINLFGTGCQVFKIQPTPLLLEKLKATSQKLNTTLEHAIFDADFFKELDNNEYKSISDLSETIIHGLLEDHKSHIEIRIKGRKKRMISVTELINQESLLPLYNIEIKAGFENLKDALIIIEKEIGLVSCFKIETEKLDLDKMKFEIFELDTGIEKLRILCGLQYDGKSLITKSSDTLVTANYSILKF